MKKANIGAGVLFLALAAGCGGLGDSTDETVGSNEYGASSKPLHLTTGSFWCDLSGCGFTPFDVHVNMEFEVSGCGFSRSLQGGESLFSGNPDPNWTYGYDSDDTGCITQGGSSTYTAPATAGQYKIRFYSWSLKAPYAEKDQGTYTVNVLP